MQTSRKVHHGSTAQTPLWHLEGDHPARWLADGRQDVSHEARCRGLGPAHRGRDGKGRVHPACAVREDHGCRRTRPRRPGNGRRMDVLPSPPAIWRIIETSIRKQLVQMIDCPVGQGHVSGKVLGPFARPRSPPRKQRMPLPHRSVEPLRKLICVDNATRSPASACIVATVRMRSRNCSSRDLIGRPRIGRSSSTQTSDWL